LETDRHTLLKEIKEYRARHRDESETARAFIRFIESHPDCFERSLKVGHLTGSAWVVNRAGSHVLLTHHRKLNRWLQPGGHADGNPDVQAVALKEAEEETGLTGLVPVGGGIFDLDIHPIPARGEEPLHDHYDVRFALQAGESEAYRVSEESLDLKWVALDAISNYAREESILRMARKWLLLRSR
jgi:8-oxo-dGTP pyrophosphatase MutT (NUDIX family)